jgi:hypothetical protein
VEWCWIEERHEAAVGAKDASGMVLVHEAESGYRQGGEVGEKPGVDK